MKYKKIISAFLIFCLVFCSAFSASAFIEEVTDKMIADVNKNGKIDSTDALQVLQYSVETRRIFDVQRYKSYIIGDVIYEGYSFSSKNPQSDISLWFRDLAADKALPIMFERFRENGGIPIFSSNNELYKGAYFTIHYRDYFAENPIFDGAYRDEANRRTHYFFTATFASKNPDRDLKSQFSSTFYSTHDDVMKYGEFKPGNVDGIDYLYWDGVDDKLSPGFVFEKDGYFIYFKGENPEQNIKDFKIDLIPINENLKDKPIMQRYGDVNRDNKIDASDALRILQYSVGIVDKVLCKEPEPKPEDPDTDIDDWDGVTECIITCRVCNRNQWMRPRDGLPGGWIINDDMSYTCPDCK